MRPIILLLGMGLLVLGIVAVVYLMANDNAQRREADYRPVEPVREEASSTVRTYEVRETPVSVEIPKPVFKEVPVNIEVKKPQIKVTEDEPRQTAPATETAPADEPVTP